MTFEVRPLGPDDHVAAWRLGQLAFGHDLNVPFDEKAFATPCVRLGAFSAGALVGRLTVLEYAQWFGGRAVAMAGIGGVAVAPEHRGTGVARALLAEGIAQGRRQGAGISVLFPTAVGLYRSMGYELAGALTWTRVPTVALTRARAADDAAVVSLRRCTDDEGDLAGVASCYDAVARTTNGLLTRTTPPFTAGVAAVLEHDVVTLALEDGQVAGYVAYARGTGYDEDSVVTVYDLIATTAGARAALLRQLGSWASVAPHTELRLLSDDADALLLPDALPAPAKVVPWMLRILDLGTAIAARGWPPAVSVEVDLDVVDPIVPANAGAVRLVVHDGVGRVEAMPSGGGPATVHVDVRALGVLYAGAASPAALARAGLLAGPSHALSALDSAFAGAEPQCLDYF